MEAAIYEDCHNLIEKFVNIGSFKFESFCLQWKNMMFQHMYSCQTSVIEVLLTTSTIFHVAKRTICAKDAIGKYLSTAEDKEQRNILRRIGGLYLLYAVYFKQPTKRYIKVQVSMETWRNMTTFIESLQLNPQMDYARFTFWRLYQADAFRFTALDYMLGLEGLVDFDQIGQESKEDKHSENVRVKLKYKLSAVTDLSDALQDMTKLEDAYNNFKQAINGPEKPNQTVQKLPATRIYHSIQDAVNNIKNIINNVPAPAKNQTNPATSSTRRNIKRKATGFIEYYEEPSPDDTDDFNTICETSQKRINKRPYKKSQWTSYSTALGMFSQNLPDHITKDLVDDSSTSDEDEQQEVCNQRGRDLIIGEDDGDELIKEKT